MHRKTRGTKKEGVRAEMNRNQEIRAENKRKHIGDPLSRKQKLRLSPKLGSVNGLREPWLGRYGVRSARANSLTAACPTDIPFHGASRAVLNMTETKRKGIMR